ncbi:MAG: aspartate racemase [Firmicutes bacterium HGW-Firmicutes-11]|nr:MAG: aspartate racemase [Firmicutes bacterium HGW-Firmicutes-11]
MWNPSQKVLGVVGGMGPLATQLFYRRIIEKTDAVKDQDHLDMILLNHASMPDRTEAILSGNTDDLYRLLLADILFLETSGVAAIAIPCNTSHLLVDQLQTETQIPILHMIRETASSIRNAFPTIRRVGLLATDGTIRSGLYQQELLACGIEAYVPGANTQKLVMKIIYDGIKSGNEIDYNDFITIEGELSANGCQSAVLACTELSCFKEMYRLPRYYIDAMDVLAERSIEACGKCCKT